jgi:2,3-bisphosphoglycerate-independent phosphoglycerate mutase
MRPVALIIRDGWGVNEETEGNAVLAAKTPNIDRYKEEYPWTMLDACGEAVGLPEGYQGSSEVGHLNMGAGRVVVQELKRIDDGLTSGELFETEKWKSFMSAWMGGKSRLHLMGLLQDEGVHAHQEHLFKIMRRARDTWKDGEIIIHPFLDGRDTPPRSTLEYIGRLQNEMEALGNCRIGTLMGRYYSMDRSKNYVLTSQAYNTLVFAEGRKSSDAVAAVEESYKNDKTPDGVDMTDEYILPYAIGGYDGMRDGDVVMHTNYRQDRAIQLTQAFVCDDYPGERKKRLKLTYLGFTRYWDQFDDYLLGAMGGDGAMDVLLGEVISNAGLRQLRIAETQKYRHVTSFFNGKSTTPYKGEDDVNVPSSFDPATFASHPEMDAYTVTDELLKRLENNPYAFIVCNLANCDMVGHTGDMKAATKAVEVVDECVGKIVERLLELDAKILVTADHGNAEQMVDYETGLVKTSHTLNPVELIYIANDASGVSLVERGVLSDIAPTVLELLNMDIPVQMTSRSLLAE